MLWGKIDSLRIIPTGQSSISRVMGWVCEGGKQRPLMIPLAVSLLSPGSNVGGRVEKRWTSCFRSPIMSPSWSLYQDRLSRLRFPPSSYLILPAVHNLSISEFTPKNVQKPTLDLYKTLTTFPLFFLFYNLKPFQKLSVFLKKKNVQNLFHRNSLRYSRKCFWDRSCTTSIRSRHRWGTWVYNLLTLNNMTGYQTLWSWKPKPNKFKNLHRDVPLGLVPTGSDFESKRQ